MKNIMEIARDKAQGIKEPEQAETQGSEEPAKKKRGGQQKYERPKEAPIIFRDPDVCRLLGRNRKRLILARKTKTRGVDWDCIEHHAGMTLAWILKENPKADIEKIRKWAIQPGDGIATVEIVQHTRDIHKLVCRRLSDGETVVVLVDDAANFIDGEQIDVEIRSNNRLNYRRELNI